VTGEWLRLPYLAAAALLVVAGGPKVVDPLPLVRALRSAGLAAGRFPVRLFAIGEVVLGVAAMLSPARGVAAAVAVTYAGLTAFVGHALRRGGVLASCGCFGTADTPPSRVHAALTASAAAVAAALAADPPVRLWPAGPAELSADVALVALLGLLAWQVLAVLPATTPAAVRSIRRPGPAAPGRRG
jgi:hypothetical protein